MMEHGGSDVVQMPQKRKYASFLLVIPHLQDNSKILCTVIIQPNVCRALNGVLFSL